MYSNDPYDERFSDASGSPHADAHREWHRNAGVPVGLGSCPWDVCDPSAYYDGLDEDDEGRGDAARADEPTSARPIVETTSADEWGDDEPPF
jgi:hypothetical protein